MLLQIWLGDSPTMEFVRTVAITVLSISFIVFIALFGRLPAFRKTPIGWLHRLLMVQTPNVLVSLDQRFAGGRITTGLQRSFNYMMNDKHPVVMIFFILLQSISEILFIPPALSFPSTGKVHYFVMMILISLPYITLYYCYATQSTVNFTNHSSSLSAYPYDFILYHPHVGCRTCRLPKPPRSKHCSICKVCVQKQDHHCIWINNCVGRNNAIWFIALLISISTLLVYASVLGYEILISVLQNRFVPPELTRGSATAKYWSTRLDWYQWLDAWAWAIATQPRIGAVTLLCIMCCPLASAFLIYHVYLLWAGMTTNESSKWADWKEDIADDLVWKARIEDIMQEDPGKYGYDSNPGLNNWSRRPEWLVSRRRIGRPAFGTRADERESEQIWRKVTNLSKDVENIYDVGFWANLKDVVLNRG